VGKRNKGLVNHPQAEGKVRFLESLSSIDESRREKKANKKNIPEKDSEKTRLKRVSRRPLEEEI